MIALDTNAVIAAILFKPTSVRERLEAILRTDTVVAVSTIVLHEMWYGVYKSSRPDANSAALAAFLGMGIVPWPLEPEDAQEAGEIRGELERIGTPIGPYDFLIAGQARRRNATLVTANTKEFSRVPGLKIEDWAR